MASSCVLPLATLKSYIKQADSCFSVQRSKIHVTLKSIFCEDAKQGVISGLREYLKKYNPRFGGICMGFDKITLLETSIAHYIEDIGGHLEVEADVYVFLPRAGINLEGTVNRASASHINCLTYGVFNVTLAKQKNDENWLGNNLQIGQKVLYEVTSIDLSSTLPYIKGQILQVCSGEIATAYDFLEEVDRPSSPLEYSEGTDSGVSSETMDFPIKKRKQQDSDKMAKSPIKKTKKTKDNVNTELNDLDVAMVLNLAEAHNNHPKKKKMKIVKEENEGRGEEDTLSGSKKKRKKKDKKNTELDDLDVDMVLKLAEADNNHSKKKKTKIVKEEDEMIQSQLKEIESDVSSSHKGTLSSPKKKRKMNVNESTELDDLDVAMVLKLAEADNHPKKKKTKIVKEESREDDKMIQSELKNTESVVSSSHKDTLSSPKKKRKKNDNENTELNDLDLAMILKLAEADTHPKKKKTKIVKEESREDDKMIQSELKDAESDVSSSPKKMKERTGEITSGSPKKTKKKKEEPKFSSSVHSENEILSLLATTKSEDDGSAISKKKKKKKENTELNISHISSLVESEQAKEGVKTKKKKDKKTRQKGTSYQLEQLNSDMPVDAIPLGPKQSLLLTPSGEPKKKQDGKQEKSASEDNDELTSEVLAFLNSVPAEKAKKNKKEKKVVVKSAQSKTAAKESQKNVKKKSDDLGPKATPTKKETTVKKSNPKALLKPTLEEKLEDDRSISPTPSPPPLSQASPAAAAWKKKHLGKKNIEEKSLLPLYSSPGSIDSGICSVAKVSSPVSCTKLPAWERNSSSSSDVEPDAHTSTSVTATKPRKSQQTTESSSLDKGSMTLDVLQGVRDLLDTKKTKKSMKDKHSKHKKKKKSSTKDDDAVRAKLLAEVMKQFS